MTKSNNQVGSAIVQSLMPICLALTRIQRSRADHLVGASLAKSGRVGFEDREGLLRQIKRPLLVQRRRSLRQIVGVNREWQRKPVDDYRLDSLEHLDNLLRGLDALTLATSISR